MVYCGPGDRLIDPGASVHAFCDALCDAQMHHGQTRGETKNK